MTCILFAINKTEANKITRNLMKSGKIASCEPADLIINTNDETVSVCPAIHQRIHTAYIDKIIVDGVLKDATVNEIGRAFVHAVQNRLNEYAFVVSE